MRVQEQNEYQTQGLNGLGLMGGDHFMGGVGGSKEESPSFAWF